LNIFCFFVQVLDLFHKIIKRLAVDCCSIWIEVVIVVAEVFLDVFIFDSWAKVVFEASNVVLKFLYMFFHIVHLLFEFIDGSIVLLRLLVQVVDNFLAEIFVLSQIFAWVGGVPIESIGSRFDSEELFFEGLDVLLGDFHVWHDEFDVFGILSCEAFSFGDAVFELVDLLEEIVEVGLIKGWWIRVLSVLMVWMVLDSVVESGGFLFKLMIELIEGVVESVECRELRWVFVDLGL
jgi:hypothetical protein